MPDVPGPPGSARPPCIARVVADVHQILPDALRQMLGHGAPVRPGAEDGRGDDAVLPHAADLDDMGDETVLVAADGPLVDHARVDDEINALRRNAKRLLWPHVVAVGAGELDDRIHHLASVLISWS